MAKTAAKAETSDGLEERLPVVIEVIPGAAEKGLPNMYKPSTSDLDAITGSTIAAALGTIVKRAPTNREEKSMLGLVQKEYGHTSAVTINGRKVNPETALVSDFLVERKTESGNRYMYMAVKVIKPQEGGLYLR